MNFTGRPESKRKRDVYQCFRSAFVFRPFNADFHTCGATTRLAANTEAPFHNSEWPLATDSAARRPPPLLRLDSQGESAKNSWVYEPSLSDTSAGNVRALAVFSDAFQRFSATHTSETQLLGVRHYNKPELVTSCSTSFTITSAVTQFCRHNDFMFPSCQRKLSLTSRFDDAAYRRPMHPLPHVSDVFRSCTYADSCHGAQKLKDSAAVQDNRCEELRCNFHVPQLVRSLACFPVPGFVDLTALPLPLYGSTFSRLQREDFLRQLSVVSFSSDAACTTSSSEVSWFCRQSRFPRFNCKRKWYRSVRRRKRQVRVCSPCSSGIGEGPSDVEQVYSGIDCNEYMRELKPDDAQCLSSQLFSSVFDPISPCTENDSDFVNDYCYQRLLPSSFQEPQAPKSFSFSSSWFISGHEVDSSDSCSTDSDECQPNVILSPCWTDGTTFEALVTELPPRLNLPCSDDWLIEFSTADIDTADSSLDTDDRSEPGDDIVFKHSLRLDEANARWNDVYSIPGDICRKTTHRRNRVV